MGSGEAGQSDRWISDKRLDRGVDGGAGPAWHGVPGMFDDDADRQNHGSANGLEVLGGANDAFAQFNLCLEVEQLLGEREVGLATSRVVLG